jgi:arylformamidase
MPEYFDLSLPITDELITYPGDPEVRLQPHARIAAGDDVNVTTLSLGSHTGTHIDAPRHFIDGARTVDALPLEWLIGPARVVELPPTVRAIGPEDLRAAGSEGAQRLLLRTRNSRLWAESGFREDFAYLTGAAATHLVAEGVKLVGIDYLSIEQFDAQQPVAHRTLLGAEVIIVEGLDLRAVPAGDYELICLPLRLAGLDGAPARVVLRSMAP